MKYHVTLEGQEHDVEVEAIDGGWRCKLDESEWIGVPGRWQGRDLRLGTPSGDRVLGAHIDGDRVRMQLDGTSLVAQVLDPRKARAQLDGAGAEGEVRVPMPGVVVRIEVSKGDEVDEGQVLIVVEAMKMENEFKASSAGVVESIEVEIGQALEADTLLIKLA